MLRRMNTSTSAVRAPFSSVSHHAMANAIRALAMDAVEQAKSGHPGMPMGMADVATVLFTQFINICPTVPQWPDRDRFVLSAGHGSMLQYALHYLVGYPDMTMDEIRRFRQWGARTAGHPEYGHAAGIETTTGPLGQGIANAVGMALAERMMNAQFGDALVSHYTYVIAGDGCLMEGISQEAISLAGHLKLNKLIVLFDDNEISIDGPTSLATSEDQLARAKASGWEAWRIDGHDPVAITQAIARARTLDKPSLIACRTTIAKGAPTKAGSSSSHGSPLGADEIAGARKNLGWEYPPFVVPDEILEAWREVAVRGNAAMSDWTARLDSSDKKSDFEQRMANPLAGDWNAALSDFKKELAAQKPKEATRQSSQNVLDVIAPHLPALIGGSADLTGSNNTKAKAMMPVAAPKYDGSYIYYGVREHGMAAAMNGLALHGGFIPYGGTFLVFTDYCRPSMRLSALMGQRVIYVMTHDSIGLGEDGPTHQPVEHLAALRAIPNLHVMRPADAAETVECWALALASEKTPSVLVLSRQAVPYLRTESAAENKCALGAYVLRDVQNAKATLIGTGTELSLCVEAAEQLAAAGIPVRVVSMPCFELFAQQPDAYRRGVLGTVPRIACEAAIEQGWEKWLGEKGSFIGMKGFGASAPAPELYKQFGITADALVDAVKKSI